MSTIISSTGTLTVRATVKNGATETTDFVKDIDVDVKDPQPFIPVEEITTKNILLEKNTSAEVNCKVTPINATKANDVIYKSYYFADENLVTISGNTITAGNSNAVVKMEARIIDGKKWSSSEAGYYDAWTTFNVYICDEIVGGGLSASIGYYLEVPADIIHNGHTGMGSRYPLGIEFPVIYGCSGNPSYPQNDGGELYINGKLVDRNPSNTTKKTYICKFEKGSVDDIYVTVQ